MSMQDLNTSWWFGLKEGAPFEGMVDAHASYFKSANLFVHSDLITADTPLRGGDIVYITADAANADRPSLKRLTLATFAEDADVGAYYTAVDAAPQAWMVVEGNDATYETGSYFNVASVIRGSFEVEHSRFTSGISASLTLGAKLTSISGLITVTSSGLNQRRKVLGEVYKYTAATSVRGATLWGMYTL